uniref:serine/threonine-protein kinase n=1 Tax=Allorhizocola rhizosphaerae TaxID=1872709 RepID=UPI0013C375EA
MSPLTPGARLHDRYLLERRIGAGGMAQVWLAHDSVLGRQVAVKTLIGEAAADPGLRAGARREAQAAAKLTHPNITAVHDYGEHESTPYIVMELLHGETLADRLARGPLSWPQAAAIGGQVAGALAAAHAQGV